MLTPSIMRIPGVCDAVYPGATATITPARTRPAVIHVCDGTLRRMARCRNGSATMVNVTKKALVVALK